MNMCISHIIGDVLRTLYNFKNTKDFVLRIG